MDSAPRTSPDAAPDDRGRLSALLRLVPFARPYRGLVLLTLTGALLASLAQLTVPLVTAAVIDGPIAAGDRAGLAPLLGLALVFGIA
jgi:ATP-binding cassette subfamily B protein